MATPQVSYVLTVTQNYAPTSEYHMHQHMHHCTVSRPMQSRIGSKGVGAGVPLGPRGRVSLRVPPVLPLTTTTR